MALLESPCLVVGSGGLLGTAVTALLRRAGRDVVLANEALRWDSINELRTQFEELTSHLSDRGSDEWRVIWCAGRGNVAASPSDMRDENAAIEALAEHLRRLAAQGRTGAISFASSAGALYAGATAWPANERTEARPTHPYGFAKLAQENLLARHCAETGNRLSVHRISNLYGVDPQPHRTRGLVAHLVNNTLRRRPSNVFVPLSTSRDYIHSTDAARLMLAQSAVQHKPGTTSHHLVASERNHTVTDILTVLSRMLKRTVPFVEQPTAESRRQPRMLAFRSTDRTQRHLVRVSLEEGLQRIIQDQALRHIKGPARS